MTYVADVFLKQSIATWHLYVHLNNLWILSDLWVHVYIILGWHKYINTFGKITKYMCYYQNNICTHPNNICTDPNNICTDQNNIWLTCPKNAKYDPCFHRFKTPHFCHRVFIGVTKPLNCVAVYRYSSM